MITRENVANLLLIMNRFMIKKGADADSRRELITAINDLTGEESLDSIYINTTDNVMLPDVAVLHLYHRDFARHILDPDDPNTCPFGYTIEIHQRCFEKYTEEELMSVILHDILQNVQSDTAKIRFLKAWTAVMEKRDPNVILGMFDHVDKSEITYMAFTAICLRPFRVPVEETDYVAADEALKVAGLADAYDSYLDKVLPIANGTVEDVMSKELNNDVRDIKAIVNACLDRSIQHYYYTIRCQVPLISLERVLVKRGLTESVDFVSRRKTFTPYHIVPESDSNRIISESFANPKDDYEVRFQIDKIINSIRYAESESERDVILYKIKELSLKLVAKERKLGKVSDTNSFKQKQLDNIHAYLAELDKLRDQVVHMEIKKKRWSVYIKDQLPEGYNF